MHDLLHSGGARDRINKSRAKYSIVCIVDSSIQGFPANKYNAVSILRQFRRIGRVVTKPSMLESKRALIDEVLSGRSTRGRPQCTSSCCKIRPDRQVRLGMSITSVSNGKNWDSGLPLILGLSAAGFESRPCCSSIQTADQHNQRISDSSCETVAAKSAG